MTSPSPIPFDRAAVQAHVEMLHRLAEGHTGRETITLIQRFRVGDVDGMTSAALAYENHPHVNVYAPLAVMRRDLSRGQKGGEDDVVAVLGAVIDSDADAGRKSRSPVEPNYVVQTSVVPAANRQEFILFDRTLPRVEAKPLAAALYSASGGDSGTKDLAHVWRIPGTANWPNRKKVLERNRPRDPQPVRVLKAWDGSLTSVDELRRVLAAQTGLGAKANGHAHEDTDSHDVAAIMARLGAGLRKLIAAPPIAGEDRSATLASVVTSMIRAGFSDDKIQAVIEAHPNGIGAKYIGRPDLAKEIERLRNKFGTEWRQHSVQTGVTLGDFRAYMPMHSYIYTPAREL